MDECQAAFMAAYSDSNTWMYAALQNLITT